MPITRPVHPPHPARHPHPVHSARPDRAATLRALVLTLLVALSSGCRGRTPAPPEGAPTPAPEGVSITGRCAEQSRIVPAPDVGGADWAPVTSPAAEPCFTLTAADADASGVAVDSAFTLASVEPLGADAVAALLRVEPEMALDVVEAEGSAADRGGGVRPGRDGSSVVHAAETHRYTVTPASPLAPGSLVRFTLLDTPGGRPVAAWGFQAQAPLSVVQTVPADRTTGVPVDTGIELTFNYAGVSDVEPHFSIRPNVEGTFETRGRTVAFVPEALEPLTLYTVTVEPGVALEGSQRTLDTPFTLRFETGAEGDVSAASTSPRLQFLRALWEARTSTAPALSVLSYDGTPIASGTRLNVTLYRYPDRERFLEALTGFAELPPWAIDSRARYRVDPLAPALTRVATFDATLAPIGQVGEHVVPFPTPLEAGLYLVDARRGETPLQAWLQVTDVAAYAAASERTTLVWVSNARTGQPVDGAAVTLADGVAVGTTGADGVALVDTPESLVTRSPVSWPPGARMPDAVGLLVVAADGAEAILPLGDVFQSLSGMSGLHEFAERGDAGRYWRYLYTDRAMYRMNDTVHVWGVARARDDAVAEAPLAVEVIGYGGASVLAVDYQPAVVARAAVEAGADGTFVGELPLEAAAPGYYTLQLRAGDAILAQQAIEVQDFVKPAYKLDLGAPRAAIFAGESISFTVRAAFFEGSPVPGLTLNVEGDVQDTLTTDAAGRASIGYTAPRDQGGPYGDYRWANVNVTPALAEEADIYGQAAFRVFSAAIGMEASARHADGLGQVEGTLYGVDLARLNDRTAAHPDDYRGEAVRERRVTAEVVEIGYTQRQIGTVYDPIEKVTVPEYAYDEVRTPAGTFDATSDADGAFGIAFPVEPDRTYEVTLAVEDDAARRNTRSLYLYTGATGTPSGILMLEPDSRGPFALGDAVKVTVTEDGAATASGEGNRYLFLHAVNDIGSYTIQDGAAYPFTFDETHVPNTNVVAVWLAGGVYREVRYPLMLKYDQTERALTIKVTPDRATYAPGDEATLAVEVTDAEGRPARAHVLLSAVDEAIHRMQGPEALASVNILETLYRSVGTGILGTYASHQAPRGEGGAEGGGGGGGRDLFKDTALFEAVETGANGRASVTLALPDNLTSWHVTSLAVTGDLAAGNGMASVPVSLPVFADVTLATSYLASDAPLLRLRAFGAALSDGDPMAFTVDAPTLFDGPLEAEGTAFEAVDVALPPLRPGRHALSVTVEGAGETDTLIRPVDVVASRLARAETAFTELAAGDAFAPPADAADAAVTLVLSDLNQGRYLAPLNRLAAAWSGRMDAALARSVAWDVRSAYFGTPAEGAPEFHVATYQTEEGGLALVPYGGADLDAGVRAAAAAPGRVGREQLTGYFTTILDDPESDRVRATAALYGLAALGQPVLPRVQALAGVPDLDATEQLHVALAAAELGDMATAGTLYRALLAAHGEARGAAVRLNVAADPAEILNATSLAAVLGAMLGDGLAPALFQYTLDNANPNTLNALEQVMFVAEVLPRLAAEPARFRYTLNGEAIEGTTSPDGTANAHGSTSAAGARAVVLQLTPDRLAALDLRVTEGRLGVAATTEAPFDPAGMARDASVSVGRSYLNGPQAVVTGADAGEGVSEGPVRIADGDLVRITLDYALGPAAVDGCYQVSDLLPTGLVAVTQPYLRGIVFVEPGAEADYPYAVDGPRVSFCVDRAREGRPLTYYARVLGKGAFVAEPALIQAQRAPESANVSEPMPVEIE